MEYDSKFLHSLFEVSHVEFQTYDLSNNKLIFSSGVTRKLLGYSEQEYHDLSNNFYKAIIHPDDLHKVEQTIGNICAAKAGDVIEMTLRVRKRDGSYMWLYSRQMIYEREGGQSKCTIIREVEDITLVKKLENELEDKVGQLNEISYKNSHLLRGPVASIIGLVNLIEDQRVTGDHNRQVLHFLKETVIKLDEVIHEINGLTRSE